MLDGARRGRALFPAKAFKLRLIGWIGRVAEAEISDEIPLGRHIKIALEMVRIEDRHPAEPHAPRACDKPHLHHGTHCRCVDHLRHCLSAEAVASLRCRIAKDGELKRRRFDARKLEFHIVVGPIGMRGRKRYCVRDFEVFGNRRPRATAADVDQTPRLRQPNGRRGITRRQDRRARNIGDRLRLKPAHVASPLEQGLKLGPKPV